MVLKTTVRTFAVGAKVRIVESGYYGANGKVGVYAGPAPDGGHSVTITVQGYRPGEKTQDVTVWCRSVEAAE